MHGEPDKRLYLDVETYAERQYKEWSATRPTDAALIQHIAEQPQAIWLTDDRALDLLVARAPQMRESGSTMVLVVYNIPGRDLGSHSKGGAAAAREYRDWIVRLGAIVAGMDSIIVLEPDGLAHLAQMGDAFAVERCELLQFACQTLEAAPRAKVYIDVGHPRWHPAEEISERLASAGLRAHGIALNVSNFIATEECIAYGEALHRQAGMRFIVDTSRNGLGPLIKEDGAVEWCNPPGRALGSAPSLYVGHPTLDGLLWIKRPGESDGPCNGGPPAGAWWPEYALGLAKRAAQLHSNT